MLLWFRQVPFPLTSMSNNPTYFERQFCPLCGHPAADATPFMSSQPRAEDMPFDEKETLYRSYSSDRTFFTFYRCPSCQGLFCRTYFSEDQLQQLYTHQAENMSAVSLANRARTQQGYFRMLKKHAKLDGQLLELGPDIGLFTQCCVEQGHFEKFWLYEPNVDVHDALRKAMGQSEFFLTQRPYTASDMPEQSLSTAVLIHVLDHILNLESLLNDLHRSLKPGGLLFIVTHDEASLLSRLLRHRWPPYAICHTQLFSPVSITRSLKKFGFEVVSVEKCPNEFTIGYLANSLLTIMGVTSASRVFPDILPVRVQLGNIATFARRI